MDLMAAPDRRKSQVHCDAGDAGQLQVGTDTLSVRVGQRMRTGNQEEMWDFEEHLRGLRKAAGGSI